MSTNVGYNLAIAQTESAGDPRARGQSGPNIRAAAAGKFQLTATTAEDLVRKYSGQYPELRGMTGEQILDRVALDEQLQDDLQRTLVHDQGQTIRNMGGDPRDPQAHALLHRFGSGVTRKYISGDLDMNTVPGIDKTHNETPAQYLAKFNSNLQDGRDFSPAPMTRQPEVAPLYSTAPPAAQVVNRLQPPTPEPERNGLLARIGNFLTPGQPFGDKQEPWQMSERKQKKMAKLEAKLADEKWAGEHEKKAAKLERKLAYLQALQAAGKDGKLTLTERSKAYHENRPKAARALDWGLSVPLAASGLAPLVTAAGAVSKVVGNIKDKPKVERAGDEMLGIGGRASVLTKIPGVF